MYSCIDFFNESIHAETRSATPFHIYPVESLSSPYVNKEQYLYESSVIYTFPLNRTT